MKIETREELRELEYESKGKASLRNGIIEYSAIPDWSRKYENEVNVRLTFDETRNEWIAVAYGDFLEGYEHGNALYLEFETPSRKLNDDARRKISEVYGVGLINLAGIDKISPRELEILGGKRDER